MADVEQRDHLIEAVNITQDFCINLFGVTTANLLSWTEEFHRTEGFYRTTARRWNHVGVRVEPNAIKSPISNEITGTALYESGITGVVQGHFVEQDFFTENTSSDLYYSVYAKPNGRDFATVRCPGGLVTFDLVNNTYQTLGSAISSESIQDVGDGWRLLRIRLDDSSFGTTSNIGIHTSDGPTPNFVTPTDITKGIYIFGANVFQGGGFPPYTKTDIASKCSALLSGDVPTKCRNTLITCGQVSDYNPRTQDNFFAKPSEKLSKEIQFIPLLEDVDLSATKLSTASKNRNSPLGTRNTVSVSLFDTQPMDWLFDPYYRERFTGASEFSGVGYNPDQRGSFWANYRARNPYYHNRALRVYRAPYGDGSPLPYSSFLQQEIAGFGRDDKVVVKGKDTLSKAEPERAVAPRPSSGKLVSVLNPGDSSITLYPGGVGASYAPHSYLLVGKEVLAVGQQTGDTFPITARGLFGTQETSHSADSNVQQCLYLPPDSPGVHVQTLLEDYAEVSPFSLTYAPWTDEVTANIPFSYSVLITKPTSVLKILGELAESAGFSLWFDPLDTAPGQVKLSAIKNPGVGAGVIEDPGVIIEGSLTIDDDPDSRISQVLVNYGQINATQSETDPNNYFVNYFTADADAGSEDQYGSDELRIINSRWIAPTSTAGESIAQRLLSRYRDIIRSGRFDLPANYWDVVKPGDTFRLKSRRIISPSAEQESIPIRLLSVENRGRFIRVGFEEVRFFEILDSNYRPIWIRNDRNNISLRQLYDEQFSVTPKATDIVECFIDTGIVVGSVSTAAPAFDAGSATDWPSGISITINLLGSAYIAGAGGRGGDGAPSLINYHGQNGSPGGPAFKTRIALTFNNSGTVGGGGGGGAGGSNGTTFQGGNAGGSGGGGGAGRVAGGGGGGRGTTGGDIDDGYAGSLTAGGSEGDQAVFAGAGGDGGGLGQAGNNALNPSGAVGGGAGVAVDGASYINGGAGINSGNVLGVQTG